MFFFSDNFLNLVFQLIQGQDFIIWRTNVYHNLNTSQTTFTFVHLEVFYLILVTSGLQIALWILVTSDAHVTHEKL